MNNNRYRGIMRLNVANKFRIYKYNKEILSVSFLYRNNFSLFDRNS